MALDIIKELQSWISENDKLDFAPSMGGGWERWVHGDFCASLMKRSIYARCDVPAYESDEGADLVVISNAGGEHGEYGAHCDVVKLRCCAKWSERNEKLKWIDKAEKLEDLLGFKRFGEDLKLVREVDLKEQYEYLTWRKWAIVMFTLADVRAWRRNVMLSMDQALELLKTQEKTKHRSYKSRDGDVLSVRIFYLANRDRQMFIGYHRRSSTYLF